MADRRSGMLYQVYESLPFGAMCVAAEIRAQDDSEALKMARILLPDGPGELRHDGRVVCRFGRAAPFMLRN
jgi:hypothetical protein